MAAKLSTAIRDQACDGLVNHFDVDVGAAEIHCFAGTQATNPQTALSGQALLAIIVMDDPAFGNSGASNPGEAIAANIPSNPGNVTGNDTVTWVRIYSADAADPADVMLDANAGEGAETFSFDESTFVSGGTATLTNGEFKITVPET